MHFILFRMLVNLFEIYFYAWYSCQTHVAYTLLMVELRNYQVIEDIEVKQLIPLVTLTHFLLPSHLTALDLNNL